MFAIAQSGALPKHTTIKYVTFWSFVSRVGNNQKVRKLQSAFLSAQKPRIICEPS